MKENKNSKNENNYKANYYKKTLLSWMIHVSLVRMEITLQAYINVCSVKNQITFSDVQFQSQTVKKNVGKKKYGETVIERSRKS